MVDIVRAIFNKYHFSLIRWINTIPGIASLLLAKAVLRPYFDPEKEVTLIEIPPGNIVQALAAGQIDAYFTPEPFGMMAEAKGVGRYLVKRPLQALNLQSGFPGGIFAFNSKFLKEKPILAKKVKAPSIKGLILSIPMKERQENFSSNIRTYPNLLL
jgi:ABC-type nitrate/sulfonate/bicarbonate transport system substrate-binding protein